MKKDGYVPAVVVMGDLENEGAVENQINWETFPNEVNDVKNKADDFTMMFMYAHPSKLNLVKEKLGPVLGETHLIIGYETASNKALRNFLNAIGR
jgi:hypothetical protein